MLQIVKYIALGPFFILYRIIIQVRYFLYKNGIKEKLIFKTPVISVGNITTGGTGKTPMVHFIANELKQKYSKIAIISRGYGRNSKGFILVHDGESLISNPNIAGDEPYLLASGLKNCIVAVDENRGNAIKKIEEKYSPDIFILDDGFQQLGIKIDVNIVLINGNKPFSELSLLPVGFGREPLNQLQRASFLIYTKTTNFKYPNWHEELQFEKDIYTAQYYSEIWEYNKSGYRKVDKVSKNIFAFCGIADPISFKLGLEKNSVNLIGFRTFRDHEPYSNEIIKKLESEISNFNTKNLITTEKDIVKLPDEFFEKYKIFTLRIQHVLSKGDDFIQKIISEIERKEK